jgi:hypothetical protein
VAFECAGCFEAVLVGSPVRHGEDAGGSTIEAIHAVAFQSGRMS